MNTNQIRILENAIEKLDNINSEKSSEQKSHLEDLRHKILHENEEFSDTFFNYSVKPVIEEFDLGIDLG